MFRALCRTARGVATSRSAHRNASSIAQNVQTTIRDAFQDVQTSLSLLGQHNLNDKLSTLTREVEQDEGSEKNDYAAVSRKLHSISNLKKQADTLQEVKTSLEDLRELRSLAEASDDMQLYSDILPEIVSLKTRADDLTKSLMLSEPTDINSAYVEVKSGSGGTEASAWAAILARIYTMWAHSREFTVQIVEESPGDLAGIRSKTLLVTGEYAYGYLQFESGVHRCVRMSPFDSARLRHTSFASVQVSPYFPEDDTIDAGAGAIELKSQDLKITTMRSQGAGGQHVNKTESAVRIVHLPSGITVTCQQERSQSRNRVIAMSLIRSKLYDLERQKIAQSKASTYYNLPEISWGSQIRSYKIQPHSIIKDARTGHEVGSEGVQAVLDGNIDGFLEANLKFFRTPRSAS